MKRFFSFGAGKKYIEASERLCAQAKKTNIFDEVLFYTDEDLKSMSSFWNFHGDFVTLNSKVYGYGIWKPFLVLMELEGLDENDILFYADSGCEFDLECENSKQEFEKLLCHLDEHNFIGTICNFSDENMSKMDLIKFLNMENYSDLKTEQIQGTAFIIKKTDRSVELVKEWYKVCSIYHMIDDNLSIVPNSNYFKEHQNVQSVLSLLIKKKKMYNNPGEISLNSVICLSRNHSGIHKLACRITGSKFYSKDFGDEFIEVNQIIHMSKIIRNYNPQYVLETGFASGRTTATMILSCSVRPIKLYVNIDKNYCLYHPISTIFRQKFLDEFPFFLSYERRSNDLFRENIIGNKFSEGIDWFTVDGDPTYEGILGELCNVFPYLNSGGIIYVVPDRLKIKNFNFRDATNLFIKLFQEKIFVFFDDVMGKEICYIIKK